MADQTRKDLEKFTKDMLELDEARSGYEVLRESSRLPQSYRDFIGQHMRSSIALMETSEPQLSYLHRLSWAVLTDRMQVADTIWQTMNTPLLGAFLAAFLCRQLSQQNF